jgi:hypothetical protein
MKTFKRLHPASVRTLKQFEKDGIKWEKLAKEIAQK